MSFTLTYRSFPDPGSPLRYAKVPWDSEVYGFPFYELKCEGTSPEVLAQYLPLWLSSLPSEQLCFVYSKIPITSIALSKVLTHHEFYPVEALFKFKLSLDRFKPFILRENSQASLSLMRETDLPEVIKIASSAFSDDRLHIDPNLPHDKADQRYVRWVENGFRDGEKIFIYKERQSSKVLGFSHTRDTEGESITLSLAAVDASYKGTGIGAIMYQAVLEECKKLGYKRVITRASINNLPSINLLVRLGFKFYNSVLTFHWFRNPAEKESIR